MALCWLATSKPATAKYYRTHPPAHYLLNVDSFEALSGLPKYGSGVFAAGGYSWRLSIYPNGRGRNNRSRYISLYLLIVDLPPNQTVLVNYRLFVHVQSQNQYLTIQDADGAVSGFRSSNPRFGFPRFLSLKEFGDPSNGYLDAQGSCTFGAEVFVIQPARMTEDSFTLTRHARRCTFTFPFQSWSSFGTDCCGREFSFGGRRWKLLVYPKGNETRRDKSLSLYLEAQGLTGNTRVYVEFNLRVLDQREDADNKKNKEKPFKRWLTATHPEWGEADFMPLKDLKPGKDFVKGDTLVAEVKIIALSEDVEV